MFQPIVRIADGETIGYEALCRSTKPERTDPSKWFSLSIDVDRRVELEQACLRAIRKHGAPPDDALLFVNVSPALLAHPTSIGLRDSLPPRLVLELTEREEIDDVDHLRATCEPWLRTGARLAIDDAGAGYSSLKQVVGLLPEFIKVDRSLIADIHRDRHRQALVAALAGFASEIGASLIAEGVESRAELSWLRAADVALAQGFLLGRPAPAWSPGLVSRRPVRRPQLDRLAARVHDASTRRGACETVAAHLFRQGGLMPSVYLAEGDRLRCQAQRGLWQVLDGMLPTAGITGRTFRTGQEIWIDDIGAEPDYLEAIPGVVSELCVPLVSDDEVVGALNVESLVPLAEEVRDHVRECAELLGERLGDLPPEQSRIPMRRLAHTAASLAAVEDASRTIDAVVSAALELSGVDSAMLLLDPGRDESQLADGHRRTVGPLADALSTMTADELARLRHVLEPLTSCYTAGDATGLTVTASTSLREAGARAVVALPIAARCRRTGLLVLASTEPVPLGPEQVEPLELLAILAGSCLETATTVEELRNQARRDALTGIGNHSAFHERLRDLGVQRDVALIVADIDDFKQVNDTGGHLLGDQVLRMTTRELLAALGDPDAVFRIGGDEFAVVLSGPRARRAHVELIEREIRRNALPMLGRHGASLSLGVAHRRSEETLIDTLERADARLYLAKADKPLRFDGDAPLSRRGDPTASRTR